MKISDIVVNEMTWQGPSYEKISQQFGDTNKEMWLANGNYIGDIEDLKVIHYNKYYSLWLSDELVAYSSLTDNVVDDVWVSPQYRGQKLFSKLLWFYKTRLHKDQLIMGPTHSPDMQEIVKGMKYLKKSWVNVTTKEIEPFVLSTIDNFYSRSGITDWRLMLENSNYLGEFPMFNAGSSYISESFLPYVDEEYDERMWLL